LIRSAIDAAMVRYRAGRRPADGALDASDAGAALLAPESGSPTARRPLEVRRRGSGAGWVVTDQITECEAGGRIGMHAH
jgi:hypothetical protein